MEPNLTPAPRFDKIDAEQFRKLCDNEYFGMLRMRIRRELLRNQDTCMTAADQVALMRAQGAVAALRAVDALPELMLQEILQKRSHG